MKHLSAATRHLINVSLVSLTMTYSAFASHSVNAETQDQQRLNNEITRLSDQLADQQKQSEAINSEVTRLEKRVGEIDKKQNATENQLEASVKKLADAKKQRDDLEQELAKQRSALAQQLQAMYTAGEQSHLRLLLKQDNPADLSRTLHYFEHLNKYRSEKIQDVDKTLLKLTRLTESIEQDQIEFRSLQTALEQQKKELQQSLQDREVALNSMKRDIKTRQTQLDKLRRAEAALDTTVDTLVTNSLATTNETPSVTDVPTSTEEVPSADDPLVVARNQRSIARGRYLQPSETPTGRFANLKGKLSAPVKGRVLYNYGARRNEKQVWRGLVIAAPGGSKVQAVAAGKVLYAGWMDGYGQLIIIEHDSNHMSLYGYNRAVYKRVGDYVKANEVIASVGNSSGQSQDALYFEIRYKKATQNPARWLR